MELPRKEVLGDDQWQECTRSPKEAKEEFEKIQKLPEENKIEVIRLRLIEKEIFWKQDSEKDIC